MGGIHSDLFHSLCHQRHRFIALSFLLDNGAVQNSFVNRNPWLVKMVSYLYLALPLKTWPAGSINLRKAHVCVCMAKRRTPKDDHQPTFLLSFSYLSYLLLFFRGDRVWRSQERH